MKLSKQARKLSKDLFQASLTDGRLDPTKVRVIAQQVATSKPRYYIDLLKDYQRFVRLEIEKHHAVIESAAPLDQRTREQLEKGLRGKYGAHLTTEFKVTPELIGGLRVKIGSDVWDSTVRSRLDLLESQLAHR